MELMMSLVELFTLLANTATILGVPIAILLYLHEKRRERREREDATYDTLDEKWNDFLKLCMESPELGLYDYPYEGHVELSPEQKIQQFALFDVLVSVLERAFLMYRGQSNQLRQSQWEGWNGYMEQYTRHKTFRKLWKSRACQYDKSFMGYMNALMGNNRQME
jgi:hypothetical protein